MSSTRIHPIWFAFLAAGAFVVACVDLALPNKYPPEEVLSDGGGGGGGTGGEGDDGGSGGGPDGGRADGGADGGGPATYTVIIKNLAFNPSQVTIHAGDRVTWLMQDSGEVHLVVEGMQGSTPAFSSPQMSAGQSYTRTFTQPATITYYCSRHPSSMSNAKVFVLP